MCVTNTGCSVPFEKLIWYQFLMQFELCYKLQHWILFSFWWKHAMDCLFKSLYLFENLSTQKWLPVPSFSLPAAVVLQKWFKWFIVILQDCSLCGLDYKLVCVNECSFPAICLVKIKSTPSRFYGNCHVFLMTH